MSTKRKNVLQWDEYFMNIALISAKRSKDPSTQVGACIVDSQNKIIGVGYNGLPRGCSDDEYEWTSPEKHLYVVHAEANAILNTNNFNSIKDSTLYCTNHPCNECAKIIIQAGINKIIFVYDKNAEKTEYVASKRLLKSAGITVEKYSHDIDKK